MSVIETMGTTAAAGVFYLVTDKGERFEFELLHRQSALPRIGDQIEDWLLYVTACNEAAHKLQQQAGA